MSAGSSPKHTNVTYISEHFQELLKEQGITCVSAPIQI